MDNDTRMSDAVHGYRVLADELTKKWGELASGIADGIDADEYDGEAMLDAWAKAMRLSAETNFLIWSEAVDAATILSGRQYDPDLVESHEFESPLPGATLELDGPLVGDSKGEELYAYVRPRKLAEGQTTFTVYADATGFPGDAYVGTVLASRGGQTESVEVFIQVA